MHSGDRSLGAYMRENWYPRIDEALYSAAAEYQGRESWGIAPIADAVSAFELATSTRLLSGIRSGTFLEELVAAYAAGAWPCGLVGDYPNAIILVCTK